MIPIAIKYILTINKAKPSGCWQLEVVFREHAAFTLITLSRLSYFGSQRVEGVVEVSRTLKPMIV